MSNAALGLPVSLCWLKLLLASALAFNFSPLNNPLDLPTVVFLTGVQRARNKMVQGSMHPQAEAWELGFSADPTTTHTSW